jgi:hypothetical protein
MLWRVFFTQFRIETLNHQKYVASFEKELVGNGENRVTDI